MSAPTPTQPEARSMVDGVAGGALIALGALVGMAGLARGFGIGGGALSFDETTLLYLAVAGAIILLPRVKTFAFRDFKLELQEAKEKAGKAEAEAAKAREEAGQAGADALRAREEADRASKHATSAQVAATGAEDVALAAAQHAVFSRKRDLAVSPLVAPSGARVPLEGVLDALESPSAPSARVEVLKRSLLDVAAEAKRPGTAKNDPWKNVFGGLPEARGRKLTASVRPISNRPDYYLVQLAVEPTGRRPLAGDVMFFLHDEFPQPRVRVPVGKNGRAEMRLFALGAFTVGALCDDGATELELDLADLPDAPREFALAD